MGRDIALLLDTHVWVYYADGGHELPRTVLRAIEKARESGSLFVSVISVWEIALLVRRKRLALPMSPARWSEDALRLSGLNLLAFTPEIAIESVDLPEPMHKDPADRILVASARVERMTLVTRDREVLAFAKAIQLSVLEA